MTRFCMPLQIDLYVCRIKRHILQLQLLLMPQGTLGLSQAARVSHLELTHLNNVPDRVELLHLCHERGVHLVKQHRLLWQLLADVFRPNEDVFQVHPASLHLHKAQTQFASGAVKMAN